MPAPPTARQARGRSGGIGRTSSAKAERVSDDLRLGRSPHLSRRRRAAGLLLGASASLGVVTLYQLGIVRHLPDPPLPWFDSDRVDASGEAFHEGSTPDAALAVANYGLTMAMIAMGTADRAREQPWIPLLAAAKVAADAVGALGLTVEQISKHRALCAWCLAAAAATLTAVPAVVPEAREALAQLRSR